MAIAGHVSRKMLERYSHPRMAAKRTALDTLSRIKGHVTVMSQDVVSTPSDLPEVIEKNGGRRGIRTPDLLVANEAFCQLN